jgi:hypothetical protein
MRWIDLMFHSMNSWRKSGQIINRMNRKFRIKNLNSPIREITVINLEVLMQGHLFTGVKIQISDFKPTIQWEFKKEPKQWDQHWMIRGDQSISVGRMRMEIRHITLIKLIASFVSNYNMVHAVFTHLKMLKAQWLQLEVYFIHG